VHRKVDVRVIASAESGLSSDDTDIGIREDLFYRLNAMCTSSSRCIGSTTRRTSSG
jgi:transcriptional regulator of acetoin/glycerol metabolism